MMRYITADYIFPISSEPIKNGIIEIDDFGTIIGIYPPSEETRNPKPETFSGFICPGFVNAHCHLELSHMKGVISEKLGMAGFIKNMVAQRNKFSKEEIQKGIEAGEKEMLENGIVAVGDISNDDSTFEVKKKGNLKYHTFLEVFDIDPAKSTTIFEQALQLKTRNPKLETSIVPHSPYTVTPQLFKLIKERQSDAIISIHNQESEAENELFENKTGAIANQFNEMGIDLSYITIGKNSLQSILPILPNDNKTVFVHNIYTCKEDVVFCKTFFNTKPETRNPKLFFCFCPSANLYIENKLPDYQLFVDTNVKCVIGTDSLASNHQLNILEELKIISKADSEIPLDTLLTWATLNGAELLGFENELGSIEQGKKPGLVLIENVDTENMLLTEKSKPRRII